MNDNPTRIWKRAAILLGQDGFLNSIGGIYVRKWHEDWCAWISIPGSLYSLAPLVGVYNEELLRLHNEATERVGGRWVDDGLPHEDVGPPLIMAKLEELIGSDPDCTRRISWHYKGDRYNTGPELSTSVADDIVYCLRKKAYPFFDGHRTLESVVQAARTGFPSHALPYFAPIMLLKMGRHAELAAYVKSWTGPFPPDTAKQLERYVHALVDIVSRETKP